MYGFDGEKVIYLDAVTIQKQRKKLKLTQVEMAEKLSLSRRTIEKFESGNLTSLRPSTLERLLKGYEIQKVEYSGECRVSGFQEFLMSVKYSPKYREHALGRIGEAFLKADDKSKHIILEELDLLPEFGCDEF